MPRPSSEEQSVAVDIFDLGLLLLVSALGGFDVLFDAIPYARKFGQAKVGPSAPLIAVSADTCSFLQGELRATHDLGGASAAANGMGYLPPASDLLFNRRYSEHFLSFVSICLEAHTHLAPVSARDLLGHEFLREVRHCGAESKEEAAWYGSQRVEAPATGPLVSLHEMQELARHINEAPDHDPSRFFGPAKSSRSEVNGLAPSVAQSAQVYLANIAQTIAPYHRNAAPAGRARSLSDGAQVGKPAGWQFEWETLLIDTARTLGLPRHLVSQALEAQLERLLQRGAVS
jgi:hypothetical protein